VFHEKWDELTLGFSGVTLTKIIVRFNKLDKLGLEIILMGLREQFGKESSFSPDMVAYMHTWYDENITVGMRLHYDNSEYNPRGIYLEIYDEELHYEIIYDSQSKF
jgi:hypothetical protein